MQMKEDFSEWVRGGIELVRTWRTALIASNIAWAAVALALLAALLWK
jgi:hypothetical protein